MVRTKPRAIGAYVFAGGFTWGVKQHFDVECVLEENDYGVATARRNMPEIPIFIGADRWPLGDLQKHEWDFIYGNPPCAAWSQAGAATKKGRTWDSSALVDCTRRHFGLIQQLRPKVWVWESVQRAWHLGESFVRELAREAADLGYSTTVFLHDAQWLGAPQQRKRVFFIVHRIEGRIERPTFDPPRTLEDALRGLNDPGEPLERNLGKVRWLLPHVRQGENLSSAYMRIVPPDQIVKGERGQIVGRPPFTIKRARSGQPAPVVMHELVHPTEDRGLSIKELSILCGYPATYEFVGASDAGQVGRGVCPPVAEYLAKNVAAAVRRNVPVTRPLFQVVDFTDAPTCASAPQGGTVVSLRSRKPRDARAALRIVTPNQDRTDQTPTAAFNRPLDQEGSGAFIRRLLTSSTLDHGQILDLVHAHYPASIATIKDIKWNQYKLARDARTNHVAAFTEATAGSQRSSAILPGPTTLASPPNVAEAPQKLLAPKISGAVKPSAERQPQASRQGVDPDRAFDTSSLRANSHGQWIHRDYLAHAFRWGFAGRFIGGETDVLDVGCGPDAPLINILTMPRNQVPRSYVGVDLNRQPRSHPTRQWARFLWEFNILERGDELGQFDLVTCLEVIEHMRKGDGESLLAALRERLRPDGKLLLSTPVYNGKAAANHLHEWTISELSAAIDQAGLRVAARHGTFASKPEILRAASQAERALYAELERFLSGEVVACFLASKYPDASRNNIWVLQADGT